MQDEKVVIFIYLARSCSLLAPTDEKASFGFERHSGIQRSRPSFTELQGAVWQVTHRQLILLHRHAVAPSATPRLDPRALLSFSGPFPGIYIHVAHTHTHTHTHTNVNMNFGGCKTKIHNL